MTNMFLVAFAIRAVRRMWQRRGGAQPRVALIILREVLLAVSFIGIYAYLAGQAVTSQDGSSAGFARYLTEYSAVVLLCMPVLCVMAQADRQPKLNQARNAFEEPAVLVIEDIDLWAAPAFDQPEDIGGLIMSTLSRGAREAVNLIRSSADDPDVFVLCTSALGNDVDPYFFDLLGPVSAVDIDYPTEKERADIWMEIAREHPSVRGVDRDQLVRFSQGMPRFDMHMAAREAIEEAYKDSLTKRRYIPVTTDNLFDKLAAYQPLDSPEYKALEQAVVDDFRRELDHLDDLLKGDGQ